MVVNSFVFETITIVEIQVKRTNSKDTSNDRKKHNSQTIYKTSYTIVVLLIE